ncbi:MAG: hypothetical protein HUJ29_11775 [Gammaproteobacteria bacterium]|nr:hypothetical protein [Gammaproteobacteria bacterium]
MKRALLNSFVVFVGLSLITACGGGGSSDSGGGGNANLDISLTGVVSLVAQQETTTPVASIATKSLSPTSGKELYTY